MQAKTTIIAFQDDLLKYSFISIDDVVIHTAKNLLSKYGNKGLRTLDGIQLATAVKISKDVDLFVTADKLLNSFFQLEKLATPVSTSA